MTRFLLFLSLVGAAIYALLIFTHDVLTDDKAENTYAGPTQPNHPVQHLSSWDAYLPTQSSNKNTQLAAAELSTPLPPRQSDEPTHNSEHGADELAATENKATSSTENKATSSTENKATSSGSDRVEPKPVELAMVVLATQTHSQASVSSPTVRFYRPGTELQVVRREGIWFEVSDPVTQERGWVLDQYL
jgi:hypothetical protein